MSVNIFSSMLVFEDGATAFQILLQGEVKG